MIAIIEPSYFVYRTDILLRCLSVFALIPMACLPADGLAATEPACMALARAVHAQRHPGATLLAQQSACRELPGLPRKTVLALTSVSDQGNEEELLLVNAVSGEVLASGESYAMPHAAVSIDAQAYPLGAGLTSFGLRGWTDVPHAQMDETIEVFNLFVVRGERIEPVLQGLCARDLIDGLARCAQGKDCEPYTSEITRSFEVATSRSHGLADIRVREQSRNCEKVATPHACAQKSSWRIPNATHYLLRFDGRRYTSPGTPVSTLCN